MRAERVLDDVPLLSVFHPRTSEKRWRPIKEDRAIERSGGAERVVGNDASLLISQRAVELFSGITLARVEREQRAPALASYPLDCLYERAPFPGAANSVSSRAQAEQSPLYDQHLALSGAHVRSAPQLERPRVSTDVHLRRSEVA